MQHIFSDVDPLPLDRTKGGCDASKSEVDDSTDDFIDAITKEALEIYASGSLELSNEPMPSDGHAAESTDGTSPNMNASMPDSMDVSVSNLSTTDELVKPTGESTPSTRKTKLEWKSVKAKERRTLTTSKPNKERKEKRSKAPRTSKRSKNLKAKIEDTSFSTPTKRASELTSELQELTSPIEGIDQRNSAEGLDTLDNSEKNTSGELRDDKSADDHVHDIGQIARNLPDYEDADIKGILVAQAMTKTEDSFLTPDTSPETINSQSVDVYSLGLSSFDSSEDLSPTSTSEMDDENTNSPDLLEGSTQEQINAPMVFNAEDST